MQKRMLRFVYRHVLRLFTLITESGRQLGLNKYLEKG